MFWSFSCCHEIPPAQNVSVGLAYSLWAMTTVYLRQPFEISMASMLSFGKQPFLKFERTGTLCAVTACIFSQYLQVEPCVEFTEMTVHAEENAFACHENSRTSASCF